MSRLSVAPLTHFDSPGDTTAPAPPEERGVARDGVRMLVATDEGVAHAHFRDLPAYLAPGDLRTAMHQAAFPGEDISDRPLPETVVPALRELLRRRPANGRYRAADFAPAAAGSTSEAVSA